MTVLTSMDGTRMRQIAIAALAAASLSGCVVAEPAFQTLAGPETREVLDSTTGHVAVNNPRLLHCALVVPVATRAPASCLSYGSEGNVPGLLEPHIATVYPEGPGSTLFLQYRNAEQGATDPSRDAIHPPGTIALIRARCTEEIGPCHAERETLASWPSAYLNAVYNKTIAVSPDGRWAAVVPNSRQVRFADDSPRSTATPRFRTSRPAGDLVMVDLGSGKQHVLQPRVMDGEPISWSSDGKRLLVTRVETVEALPPSLAAEVHGDEGLVGTGLPVVETIDAASGRVERIALGMNAVWSPDQRSLVFEPSINHLELRDLETGSRRELALPGYVGRYPWLRFVGSRRVMYRALPGDGTTPAYTGHNSPLIGPKQLITLKVADIDTLRFATVYTDLDPRTNVGYGSLY